MWQAIVSTVLVGGGLLILTAAVYGMVRMPDIYTRLHAASKAAFLGIVPFVLAIMTTGDRTIIARSTLIVLFLTLTTPVAAHIIGQAAYESGEPMETPGALDESGARSPGRPSPIAEDEGLERTPEPSR